MRTERCACGGYITAPDGDWDAIGGAVLQHSRTERHQSYVNGASVPCIGAGEPCLVMVPPTRLRCHFCVRTMRLRAEAAAA